MTTIHTNVSTYSRYNISEVESDIKILVREYRERIELQLAEDDAGIPVQKFISFAETPDGCKPPDDTWIHDNYERFLNYTPNDCLASVSYMGEMGFITAIVYSSNGEFLIVGHATGLIQLATYEFANMSEYSDALNEYANSLHNHYDDHASKLWYPMFYNTKIKEDYDWIDDNYEIFIKDTPNKVMFYRWYLSSFGSMTSMVYSPNGQHIIVGHCTGLIQMRHGTTGVVLATLRNIQFPPKPVYALEYSRTEERVCYAACTDGAIYRVEIPMVDTSTPEAAYCIRADPTLECLTTQYYSSPGPSCYSIPFITQRSPALSLGLTCDQSKLVVGYGDASLKVFDMETQKTDTTYKVHKLRLQFIPKKLQRMHFGEVCAVRCHDQKPTVFATAAWDKTMRVWDIRCQIGCVMTFEGVDITHNSIDLNRNQAISGSWMPTESLCVWDLVAHKRLTVVRVQNRRPDVDGEYIYACQYWRSNQFNRKGKYAIIGGSGTNCVEVINLHNRYICCSYPAPGSVLAIASYDERIAFGGTAPVFQIVSFHDPKHEKYTPTVVDFDFDYTKPDVLYEAHETNYSNLESSSETGFLKSKVSEEGTEAEAELSQPT